MSDSRILGSITGLELTRLGESASRLIAAGVDGLHVDLADGVFVPDLTFGPRVVAALRRATPAFLEVHLMVSDPERMVPAAAEAGASRVSFHVESTRYPWRVVSLAEKVGVEIGVALNPVTPVATIEALAAAVSFVSLLTTDPDHAGECLLPGMPERVAAVRALLPDGTTLEVDGGVDAHNIGRLRTAGANDFVVGRAIYASDDWAGAVSALRAEGA